MQACASPQGLCLLEFTDTARLDHERQDLCRLLCARTEPGRNTHTIQAEQEIAEYFSGSRQHFDVTLHTPGTVFQQGVWSILQRIPYGRIYGYEKVVNLQVYDTTMPSFDPLACINSI